MKGSLVVLQLPNKVVLSVGPPPPPSMAAVDGIDTAPPSSSSPFYGSICLLAVGLISLALLRRFAARRSDGDMRLYPIVGHLPQFLANRHRLADWQLDILSAAPSNTVVLRLVGNIAGVVTANPDVIEYALRAHFDNFAKGPRLHDTLHDFLGRGIFNSDGEPWRAQRKAASYEFNTRSLRAFVARCVDFEVRSRLLPLLRRAATAGAAVDMQDMLECFAFDTVCMVAFDFDPQQLNGNAAAGFADAFRDSSNISVQRFRYAVPGFWRVKKALGVGSEKRLRDSIALVHAFADEIIKARRKELAGEAKNDLLSRFMASEHEHYSDDYLRDIVISFLLAGRETTSSALSWFFWLLSTHAGVLHRIRQEIVSVRGNSGADMLGLDELREMNYLHAALTESMRLFPPVPLSHAEAKADDVLPDGTAVKKGWFVSYNTYAMGRLKSVWGDDAGEFKPERWLDGDGAFKPESPFKYPIFHGGPRMCLGKEMAYIQMKSVAACVVGGFDVEVVAAQPPEKELSLTLRMKAGLPVKFKAIEQE